MWILNSVLLPPFPMCWLDKEWMQICTLLLKKQARVRNPFHSCCFLYWRQIQTGCATGLPWASHQKALESTFGWSVFTGLMQLSCEGTVAHAQVHECVTCQSVCLPSHRQRHNANVNSILLNYHFFSQPSELEIFPYIR